jgi:long-chain acyl-CoA synthetase
MLERFLALADAAPEAAALVHDERVVTRAELLAAARAMGERFAALREGDLVAVQLPNSVDFVAAFLAALERKLVMVPVDRDATETEVGRIVLQFGVSAVLWSAAAMPPLFERRHGQRTPQLPPEARLIKTTSGSTGAPKGIVASEANVLADCVNICATMDIRADDVNFGAIPFSHSYGFSNLVTPLVVQGTAVVISNDYLPQSIVALCNRHRCTVVPLIPMVFEHLCLAEGHFESVRTFLSAGAPLSPSTSRRFRERFGRDIHSFYGCSECGGITYDRRGGAVERGTVGSAMENVALSLDRERLVVRSEAVALGYLHDAKTFEPIETFVADDLAQLDALGEVTLTGRASELINTAGRKVNPREVEQVILQLDGVRQAKVYGAPAGARGDVVAAAVVASPDVTRDEIREFCRARLSPHKVPRIVKLIDAIPVDDRGKVRRSALAEL